MSAESATDIYDAIIVGGGPGGSAAGSILAQAGKRVLILERERFPRFHIGESLIPYGNDVLRDIGVWEKLERAGFMPKLGAEFVLGNSKALVCVLFSRFLPCSHAQTFQVERARFDNILLEHAMEAGSEVWQEAKVESVNISDAGATVLCRKDGEVHELRSRWFFDASGRDSLLGRTMGLPKDDFGLTKKFATFAHFHGVERNPAPTDGHITIVRLDFGWCWIIPLDAEKTSVGLVQTLEYFKKTGLTPQENFEQVVKSTTELRRRLGDAKRVSEYASAGDYSYRYLKNAGPRWMLIGDAAGFIDPIFSSGVMLALKSGQLAAQEMLRADRSGEPLSLSAQSRYTKRVGKMCKVFLRMIQMFYDNRSFEVFMTPIPIDSLLRAVNNLVAGNTDLGWRLRWQVWLFYLVCAVQRRFPLVPRIDFADETAGSPIAVGQR